MKRLLLACLLIAGCEHTEQIEYDGVVTSITPAPPYGVLIALQDGTTFQAQLGTRAIVVGKHNHIVLARRTDYNDDFHVVRVDHAESTH